MNLAIRSISSVESPSVCVKKLCLHMMNSWLDNESVLGEGW